MQGRDAEVHHEVALPPARRPHALDASGGRLEAIPGCPALTIDLDAMWADLDAALAETD